MARLVGQTLGKYEIVEEIGRAGMATVYRAYQPSLNRSVAVKVLSEPLARDSSFRRRFDREAKAVVQGSTLTLDATLSEEEGAPRVDLGRLNRLPLSFAGGIVSRGINRGLRSVVEEAGVRFEEVRVEQNRVIIIAEEKR